MSRAISSIAENTLGCRPGERYGIEVEAERLLQVDDGLRWSEAFRKYWSLTSDGSLRHNGVEFVSNPLAKTSVPPAIAALWPYFEEGRMRPSVRTGIHVHVSCLGLNTDQVMRIALHYALMEPVFTYFAGPAREENIYCIPWYRAHDEPNAVRTFLSGERGERSPCKYSALFVGPLATFGTIELRHAPTWTDPETMLTWWRMAQALYRTYRTEYDILEEYLLVGPAGFARQVLTGIGGVAIPPTSVFDECDVESVAEILAEVPPTVHPAWGRTPMLAVEGTTLTVNVPRRNRFLIEPEEARPDDDWEPSTADWEPSPPEYDPAPPDFEEER